MFVCELYPLFVQEKNTNIKNLTGVLYTAGAVVIGIVVATMVQQRLMKKKAVAMEDEAQYDICISEDRLYPLH